VICEKVVLELRCDVYFSLSEVYDVEPGKVQLIISPTVSGFGTAANANRGAESFSGWQGLRESAQRFKMHLLVQP